MYVCVCVCRKARRASLTVQVCQGGGGGGGRSTSSFLEIMILYENETFKGDIASQYAPASIALLEILQGELSCFGLLFVSEDSVLLGCNAIVS